MQRLVEMLKWESAAAHSGRRLAWCCLVAIGGMPALAQGPRDVRTDASSVSILRADVPVAVYRFVENPAKPYFAQLCSPSGVNVLRDSPADHKHHHGLMFAVAVDGVDFWSEAPACGRQIHRSKSLSELIERRGDAVAVGPQEIEWTAPDGRVLLRESRRVSVRPVPQSGATLVTWQTRLAPPGDKAVKLTGSTYFGLGMRFLPSMDTGGRFVNADGKTGVSGTNNARSAWCAYSASADGKPVTVAMFDAPTNPRHPATWFTMDQGFAYLSATLDLSRQPLAIEPGKPLELCYHAAVWDGKVEAAKIAALYREVVGGRQ